MLQICKEVAVGFVVLERNAPLPHTTPPCFPLRRQPSISPPPRTDYHHHLTLPHVADLHLLWPPSLLPLYSSSPCEQGDCGCERAFSARQRRRLTTKRRRRCVDSAPRMRIDWRRQCGDGLGFRRGKDDVGGRWWPLLLVVAFWWWLGFGFGCWIRRWMAVAEVLGIYSRNVLCPHSSRVIVDEILGNLLTDLAWLIFTMECDRILSLTAAGFIKILMWIEILLRYISSLVAARWLLECRELAWLSL
ncbi:hypothetical protein Droror1_Dr00006657 [Drosera rotundifolia]